MQTTTGVRTREEIAVALFNLVKAATGVTDATRRLKHWDNVPEAQMPYVCVAQAPQNTPAAAARGIPYKWTMHFKVYIYVTAGQDENVTPVTQLNDLLDAIETALAVKTLTQGQPMTERQTLGNLVYDCRIVGEVETDEGTLGSISVAVVPIEVLA